MARRRIIAGNWKMYKTVPEALALVEELKRLVAEMRDIDILVCPPFTALYPVKEVLRGSNIELGAQNLFWEEEGAFTGEVSPTMLKSLGCSYVIIGHSERRKYFGETDKDVNRKIKSAMANGLMPIVCVGESIEEREAGKTEELIRRQVLGAMDGIKTTGAADIVVAYEPIWAIGTGRAATGEDANKVARLIRQTLAEVFNERIAQEIRIQYGGSVKPQNTSEFLEQPDIDGALVGGASLDAETFYKICQSAAGGVK
ncbi:MAG: triose-phosphate isomerase [Firmicutes bacterium]|nr:triose-phosphate isomerase [Bacillota bacterium]